MRDQQQPVAGSLLLGLSDPLDRIGVVTIEQPWWRGAAFYQVYPHSFADGNGDGVGDLIGLRERLDYLVELGVDALWLSPFYRSPMVDGGYDISDPCDVDPLFGTLADFDALLAAAHERRLRITVDIVPNHFSDQHPWFIQALSAGPGSRERERFIFRRGRGRNGELPPNNWPSMFGGSAWQPTADGQWYLHLFAPEQPDLNWENPEVAAEFDRILRFWLDRGVDGFRVDVAHGMAKPAGLPDIDLSKVIPRGSPRRPSLDDVRWDRDAVHDYLGGFRRVLDRYPGERMAVGEVWVADDQRLARYVRPGELNLIFNFTLLKADWGERSLRTAIDSSVSATAEVGAPCTWVLSNHDVVRHATRYGGGSVGLARARATALLQLSLPGAVYIYNGDELGLANVELSDGALRDPIWDRSEHTIRGRDGQRVPMPWSGARPPYGFTSGRSTWLPMPSDWAALTVDAQMADPDSTLALYQQALSLRRKLPGLRSAEFGWVDGPPGVLTYRRGTDMVVVLNVSDGAVPMPQGEVILGSVRVRDGLLAPDAAAWIRC